MYELLNKLVQIINTNFSEDFNKIENIIKSDELFMNLDMDEQELLLEDAKEKHAEISEKKKNLTDIKPSYRDIKDHMKKSNYTFGLNKVIESEKVEFNGKMLTEGEIMSDRVHAIFINEPTEEDLKRRAEIFEDTKIISANLPAQKSAEWLANRRLRVSASECGTLLNMNKHQNQYTFILDKVLGSEFRGNKATYHGNVFEDVVRMMYEYNNDVHTEEFSSMQHKTNPILAASPDGIVSPYCRDEKTLTKLVGRMLEIKCPTMRKIKYEGDIKDTICPVYYWCQIQQQLECLDLDECDFIQCNIERYENREAWISDTHLEYDYRSAKYGNLRGIVIELIPIKLSECDYNEKGQYSDMTIWTKTKCLFPPKIDMSLKELDDWVLNQLSNLPYGYTLHKIIYWRLIEQNCTLVLRNKEWFNSQLPTYNKIWGYVEYLRANLDVIEEWKAWIDSQPRKYNDKIMTKLDMLIEKKEKSILTLNQQLDQKESESKEFEQNQKKDIKTNNIETVVLNEDKQILKPEQSEKKNKSTKSSNGIKLNSQKSEETNKSKKNSNTNKTGITIEITDSESDEPDIKLDVPDIKLDVPYIKLSNSDEKQLDNIENNLKNENEGKSEKIKRKYVKKK